jgi:hypothetical protein
MSAVVQVLFKCFCFCACNNGWRCESHPRKLFKIVMHQHHVGVFVGVKAAENIVDMRERRGLLRQPTSGNGKAT